MVDRLISMCVAWWIKVWCLDFYLFEGRATEDGRPYILIKGEIFLCVVIQEIREF